MTIIHPLIEQAQATAGVTTFLTSYKHAQPLRYPFLFQVNSVPRIKIDAGCVDVRQSQQRMEERSREHRPHTELEPRDRMKASVISRTVCCHTISLISASISTVRYLSALLSAPHFSTANRTSIHPAAACHRLSQRLMVHRRRNSFITQSSSFHSSLRSSPKV